MRTLSPVDAVPRPAQRFDFLLETLERLWRGEDVLKNQSRLTPRT